MHPSKSISLLGFSPIIQCSLGTIRLAPALSYHQCPASWTEHRFSSRVHFDNPSSRLAHSLASQSNIAYRLGAAFSAKGRRFNTKRDIYTFDEDRRSLEKQPFTGRPASGQDAFFVSNVGAIGSMAFGVADGVGGWSDSGIDSADFSHALCRYLTQHARDNIEEQKIGSQALLQQGYADVVADESISGGGSTACIAVGHSDGHLDVAK